MHTKSLTENLKERDCLEDLSEDVRMMYKVDRMKMWTGFIWLRIYSGGRLKVITFLAQ
jgi:hypothetical protein